MKSSLGRLRRFVHKNDPKDDIYFQSSAKLEVLAQAAQDMQEMRDSYDSLLSAAAATANCAYEFAESLREMGSCLLQKTLSHEDDESGRVLSMLGKMQFELRNLVDSYRTHIISTISNPSESLLSELRTVEEMKRQCDEKRDVYEYMLTQQREKRKSKSGKGESFTMQQLQAAHDEYDEEATLCVFRLKSLKQGQSRSILTQAARHHAAQLNFFRKGLRSLEAVDLHVRAVTEQQHIDYEFTGIGDDFGDVENGSLKNDVGELSFDYQAKDTVSTSRNPMEVDEMGHTSPQNSAVENPAVYLEGSQGDLKLHGREPRGSSHSAPILPEKMIDPADKVRQVGLLPSVKLNAYILPTPIDAKGILASKPSNSISEARAGVRASNLWHSSPLEERKHEKEFGDDGLQSNASKVQLVGKEGNNTYSSVQNPPPLVEGLPLPQIDASYALDSKKVKRHAFSGPLTSKPYSTKAVSSSSGSCASAELSQVVSGMLSNSTLTQPPSTKVSPSVSPPLISSPKISELHELPRPPVPLASNPAKSTTSVGHSAPLVFRNQEFSGASKIPSVAASATPLPVPPLIVQRSFSIPSSSQRNMALQVPKHLESPKISGKAEEVTSPPLTPITLSDSKSASQSGPIRGRR